MVATAVDLSELLDGLTRTLLTERAERERRVLASLGALAPTAGLAGTEGTPDAFDTAILHHAFQQAQLAARTRDAARARRALRLWQERDRLRRRAVPTAVGPVLVVRAADCAEVEDGRLGSRMFLLEDPVPEVPEQMARTLNEAIDAALAVGCEVLRSSTAVVIWTEVRALAETCRSYTFDFLPGSVVLNWSEEPLRLAETLVHEATHSWLNECLAAENVALPEDVSFHSPWKNEERPAFGIVHAALAFAHVIAYLSRIQPAPEDTSPLADVLRHRLADELRSLESGHEAALKCFELVGSARLRTYLEAAVAAARHAA
ncbi:HEXXH motif-containing putative peptide modification protein [Streptomyces sp. NPDC052727]|uniref:aKG-HExxH-type peptide beta-hydroxylase n=1 Tax=unclassified Streptomyces TaxID=2593676 RepID=UPI00343C8FD4